MKNYNLMYEHMYANIAANANVKNSKVYKVWQGFTEDKLMDCISLVSTLISILVTTVSIVIGIRTFKSADIDRALKCLEVRDKLGESKGDEYFDYLTAEAERAIFVDSMRNGVHLAGWGYPVTLLLVCAPLGYIAASLKNVIDQGTSELAAEFWIYIVGASLGCIAILIVFISWCRHILHWTKHDSDSLKEGRVRTKLYFINKPWDFLWLSFMIMLVIFLLSLRSRTVGFIAYMAVMILIFVGITLRNLIKPRWVRFCDTNRTKLWFKVLIDDDYKAEDIGKYTV